MDTPLHALAVPDSDPSTLERPENAARELADAIAAALPVRLAGADPLTLVPSIEPVDGSPDVLVRETRA